MGSGVSRPENSCCCVIPEEIIRGEILVRLPIKLLVRFRCVCKSWNHLLSGDPEFVKSHLARNNNYNGLIFWCAPYVNYKAFHPLKSIHLRLGGSVNGLVCVYHYTDSISCVGIWNPATNHYKDIPVPPVNNLRNVSGIFFISLGFGFDPLANDYKIVCLRVTPDHPLEALVYSCNAESWGEISFISSFVSRGGHCSRPTIVNGRPYWQNYYVKHCYAMYFDFKDEDFKLLPGLKFFNEDEDFKFLPGLGFINVEDARCCDMVNLRDMLAFIAYDCPLSDTRLMDVYVFDEACGLWSKNYTVGPITLPRGMKFLNCFWNGDLLFHCGKYLKLVSVNPETHAIDRLKSGIYVYHSSRCLLLISFSFTYIESLASVKGMHLLHVRKVETDLMIVEQSS